ncbi:MAG TPA: T9SS type A sorting domain-containing protein [Saprospiraceae bacterium]|nr:T9SS type A sorting domain-containing protein [Saprospiraceae bacterium]
MYLAEATYNLDIDFSSIIWPLEPGLVTNVPFTKQLIQVIESSYDGGWIKDDKVEFYYGPEITSVLDVEYLVDAIYPNPASDEIWLKLSNLDDQATLQLHSANGTKVSEWEISEHESFSVDLLPAGIYFYFIHSGGKNYMGKMIKV